MGLSPGLDGEEEKEEEIPKWASDNTKWNGKL